jgi:O-antigen ligase
MEILLPAVIAAGFLLKIFKVSSLTIAKAYLYVACLSIVIVASSTFFPFIGGKYYFFRVSIEAALIFFIIWWAFESQPGEVSALFAKLSTQPLFLAVSVFVLMVLLSSIFAYDPHAAFWSNYERGEGGFQMLHYYIFFTLLILLFSKKEDWQLVFKISLTAAVLMILYGLAAAALIQDFIGQYSEPSGKPLAPTFWGRLFTTKSRFQGSLGNPAYVAPYLMFSIFYALYLWLGNKASKTKTKWSRGLGYCGLIMIFLLFFVLSQTRGAFLGLGVAVVAFFVYLGFSQPKLRKTAIIVLSALILLTGIAFYYRDTPLVNRLPGGRVLNISLSEDSAKTRIWTWSSAWEGFKEKPLLGWGLENFSSVFDKYFNPRHFIPGTNTETWFDRAHSVIFDYLTETGILGFLSYLAIFVVFYWQFFRRSFPIASDLAGQPPVSKRQIPAVKEQSAIGRALIFSMPIGYLVQGLILFDVLPIYINLFLFLAFSNFILTKANSNG